MLPTKPAELTELHSVSPVCVYVCRPYSFYDVAVLVYAPSDQSFQVVHTLMLWPGAFFSAEQKSDRGRQLDTSMTPNGCGDS